MIKNQYYRYNKYIAFSVHYILPLPPPEGEIALA